MAGARAPVVFWGLGLRALRAVRLEPRRGKSKRHTSLAGVALGMEPGAPSDHSRTETDSSAPSRALLPSSRSNPRVWPTR